MASIQSSTDPRIAQPAMSLRDRLAGYISGATSQLPASMQSYPDIPQMGVKQGTLAKDLMTPAENVPVLGQALSAEDLGTAAHNKDWWGMGLAALGLMPGGGAEKHAAKEAVEAGRDTLARIKAFHGSPHDFDKFEWSPRTKGTGEGAQAYGEGLYFAEKEGVARSYRDNISDSQDPLANMNMAIERLTDPQTGYMKKRLTPEFLAEQLATNPNYRSISFLKDNPEALRDFHAIIQGTEEGGTVTDEAIRAMRRLEANPNIPQKGKGSLYEVDINADPEHFLDWDKPLSEQAHIQEALPKMGYKPAPWPYSGWVSPDGSLVTTQDAESLLRAHGPKGSGEAALKDAGIPGIRFLDQGSRAAGEGSRNYVVFDDKIINIVKKNGIAAALAAGLITESQAAEMRQQGYDE